jgi:hypothetical protein
MSTETPMFSDKDYQTLLHEHTEVTGKINDMLIDFQNKAFAAGKESANEEINQLRAENERLKRELAGLENRNLVQTIQDLERAEKRVGELEAILRDARPYVQGAYECAFPDEQENKAVLESIDQALLSTPAPEPEPDCKSCCQLNLTCAGKSEQECKGHLSAPEPEPKPSTETCITCLKFHNDCLGAIGGDSCSCHERYKEPEQPSTETCPMCAAFHDDCFGAVGTSKCTNPERYKEPEPKWPKYFLNAANGFVYRTRANVLDAWFWSPNHCEWIKSLGSKENIENGTLTWKPITPSEVRAMGVPV